MEALLNDVFYAYAKKSLVDHSRRMRQHAVRLGISVQLPTATYTPPMDKAQGRKQDEVGMHGLTQLSHPAGVVREPAAQLDVEL